MSIMNKVALVIGAGDATGGAIGFATDSRKEKEVIALVEQIEACVGPIEVLVHGAGTRPARGPRRPRPWTHELDLRPWGEKF